MDFQGNLLAGTSTGGLMGKAKAKTNSMIFGLGFFFLTFLWHIDFLELLRSKYCTLNAKVDEPIKK